MKGRKRRSRLLFQLGLTFLIILIVLLTTVSFVIYETSVTGFLDGQNANMKRTLEETSETVYTASYGSPIVLERRSSLPYSRMSPMTKSFRISCRPIHIP